MHHRCLLEHINKERGTILLQGKEYELNDKLWPTLNPENPYQLTAEEDELMDRLQHSFMISERLRKHVKCLLHHGGMYSICNSNLLFHASVPLNEDGTLRQVMVGDTLVSGRELMQRIELAVRTPFDVSADEEERNYK